MRFCSTLILAASGILTAAPADFRELVRKSIANGERNWEASRQYSFAIRDENTRLNSQGRTASRDVDIYQAMPIGGVSYEEHLSHNGQPLAGREAEKERQKLAQVEHESKADTDRRRAKEKRERAFLREVPDAFDWKLLGEERLPTGPAYVLEAVPHPGYRPRSRYAKAFSKMQGKLWLDKHDLVWVKADAVAMAPVSFGFLLVRLAKGSHIRLEQMRLPDGVWVPKSLDAKAGTRIMLVVNRNFEEDITYSGYHKGGISSSAANSASAARH